MNVSEGARPDVIAAIGEAAGTALLDTHSDAFHDRSVFTLAGPAVEAATRDVADAVFARVDLTSHRGVHPRIGVVDVVPFVPLPGSSMHDAIEARDRFAAWAAVRGVPCFVYGPERSLPDVRRGAFTTLAPDTGPPAPHPTAGAIAVGARGVLVAYNLWLQPPADVALARRVASAVRNPQVRALGLQVGDRVQVSCNLVDPGRFGPGAAFDAVASHAPVERAELVGLLPADVLAREPRRRWRELDLSDTRTIEARLEQAGLGGSWGS